MLELVKAIQVTRYPDVQVEEWASRYIPLLSIADYHNLLPSIEEAIWRPIPNLAEKPADDVAYDNFDAASLFEVVKSQEDGTCGSAGLKSHSV